MKLRVNLVVTLLTLSCLTHALETTTQFASLDDPRGYRSTSVNPRKRFDSGVTIIVSDDRDKILRPTTRRRPVKKQSIISYPTAATILKAVTSPTSSKDAKLIIENRQRPRKKKQQMQRTLTALLLAYKLKFLALIPTLVGGFLLLKFTALLAGFFFALFAAVLGLKID